MIKILLNEGTEIIIDEGLDSFMEKIKVKGLKFINTIQYVDGDKRKIWLYKNRILFFYEY